MATYYIKSSKTGQVKPINSEKAKKDIAAGKVKPERFFLDASLTTPITYDTKPEQPKVDEGQQMTLDPVNVVSLSNMEEIESLDVNKKRGILKLQEIMHDTSGNYTPEERRLAYQRFYSKVPGHVERVEFRNPEKPGEASLIPKSLGAQAKDILFSREAVDRAKTDEGGMWEGFKTVGDYALGAMDLPSRTIGAVLGQGEVSSEGTYALKSAIRGDEDELKFYSDLVNKHAQRLGELAGSSSKKDLAEAAYLREVIEEIKGDIQPSMWREIMGRLGSDPTIVKSLAKGAFKAGGEAIDVAAKSLGREAPGLAKPTAQAQVLDKITYAEPELKASMSEALTVDELGDVVLDPRKVEELSGTLVTPPKYLSGDEEAVKALKEQTKEARDARFENLELQRGVDKEVGEQIPANKFDEYLTQEAKLGRTAPIDPLDIKAIKGAYQAGYVGGKSLSSDALGALWQIDPSKGGSLSIGNVNMRASNELLGAMQKEKVFDKFTQVVDYLNNPTYKMNRDQEPAKIKQLLGYLKENLSGELSVEKLDAIAGQINTTLDKTNITNSDIAGDLLDMATKLRKIKSNIVSKAVEAGFTPSSDTMGKVMGVFGKKENATFNDAYKALREDVAHITNVSKTLQDHIGITQTKDLTNAQWQKITEKVNTYVKSILKNTNSNKQKNAAESLKNLEAYLHRNGYKNLNIKEALSNYMDVARFAEPVVKGNEVVGFRMKGADGLVKAVVDSNRNMFGKMTSDLLSYGKSLVGAEGKSIEWVMNKLSGTEKGQEIIKFTARKLFDLDDKVEPTLAQIAIARKGLLYNAVLQGKVAGRLHKTDTADYNDSKPDTYQIDLTGGKPAEKK